MNDDRPTTPGDDAPMEDDNTIPLEEEAPSEQRPADPRRGASESASGGGRPSAPAGVVRDRAVTAGYPPDSGPEVRVMVVRPAFFRAYPLRAGLGLVLPVPIALFVWWLGGETPVKNGLLALLIAGAVCWTVLFIVWVFKTLGRSLEITNKRAVERRGLLSRSTDEVLHDHIRNVQVDQSVLDRVLNIGQIGIASSGQEGVEVQMQHLPDPHKLREIIDLYRPL